MEHYVLAALLTYTTMQTRDDAPQDNFEPHASMTINQQSVKIIGNEPTED
jgi:hypothetical protein